MLSHQDISLREMAAFALGRLAQNNDNQAGIVQNGGLLPLLALLESKHYNLQHNAAFALYGLADNEDNIADIIREGVLQRLLDCAEKLQVQASKVRRSRAALNDPLTGSVRHVIC
jgi:HEAT repeat protein